MKNKYVFIAVLFVVMLYACRSVQSYLTPSVKQNPATETAQRSYILNNIELPADKPFCWNLPITQLEEHSISKYPKMDITEVFGYNDINNVRAKDPKLFAASDRIYIDLLILKQYDYSFPLPGAKLLSPFGGRRKNHAGVDLKTFANDTIRAAFDGIVRMAKEEYSGYGRVIVIRHYNGLETVYSHNSRNLIAQGVIVKSGQPIALVGRTGRATTEHLHFETRINGRPFNPDILFDLKTGHLNNSIIMCTNKKDQIDVTSIQHFPPSAIATL